MLRLTLLLCCTLFLVLLIGGRDGGQMRPGLAAAARLEPDPQPLVTPVEMASLDGTGPALTVAAEAQSAPDPVTLPTLRTRGDRLEVLPLPARRAPTPQPMPAAPREILEVRGDVRLVTADAVNVRSGPSTAFPVVGRLTRGEAVLVVASDAKGWAPIRIEGDGLEGYMATRFLRPAPQ
ncbi:SH3 domain-containing protein [Cereibacter azotoformans]|uniref:SH3 domain-containing protein n=1 Tax=Cereibacter azotoformans TaxID=43057 RepID=A0A2T5K7I1_9RHOB|nr:SH3 domain-containing protein [Cereibacter azotoformans]AXQ94422.1 SH3 domain-containing protein [Cereibacter sphaeroides]MBO4170745.1 SH3 domain-containing protein [Cereibacter azotoformans]PTR18318.1 SH3 domain-containing protein [Cereibacter azotoformans]UIJ29965.1 SH3 domain-containing protein [Cereibacter azotoformans]